MATETIYWETAKQAHTNALDNLNKLVTACIENNFLGPTNIVSAYRLSTLAQVNYNSMANLLDRPGFVRVEGEHSGWYYLRDFGVAYPTTFPNMLRIPRKIIVTKEDSQPTILGNLDADKAVRSQLRAQDLLENNQVIITFDDAANIGIATYNDALQMLTKMLDSMIQLESPPERYATAIYQMSKHLHDGTFKISRE